MAAPLALGDAEIEIIDKLISVPYVEMTLKLMERFGVAMQHSDSWDRFYIKGGQKYKQVLHFPTSSNKLLIVSFLLIVEY